MMQWLFERFKTVGNRAVALTIVSGGLIGIYTVLNHALTPRYDLSVALDSAIPFLPWTLIIYMSLYFMGFVGAVLCEGQEFCRLLVAVIAVDMICFGLFVVFTSHYPRPDISGLKGTMWHWMFATLYASDDPGNTFPSIHVALALMAGWRMRLHKGGKLWVVWGVLVALSTLTVKQHYVADVVAGCAVAMVVYWLVFVSSLFNRDEPILG